MKISRLALAAALAAVWAALPLAVRAHDDDHDGEEETVEIRKRVRRDDGDGSAREDGPRHEEGQRREMGPRREGREGAREHDRDQDPEVSAKLEKLRELGKQVRELTKTMRQGTDAEKASAKTEARKVLGEMFDTKLALDSAMLQRVEKHAAELKAKIARKKAAREKAIETRLSGLSGESDDWD